MPKLNCTVCILVALQGCAMTSGAPFRDYELNKEKIVTVGSSMMKWGHSVYFSGSYAPSYLTQELRYSGIDHNVIYITYREFADDIARTPFTQELRYDLTASKAITYQDVVISVLEATASSIKFVVTQEPEVMRVPSGVYTSAGNSNPCLDSLYLTLKGRLWYTLTTKEKEYIANMDQACESFSRAGGR